MVTREITITNTLGLHARPASMIVKTATRFAANITLIKDGVPADAKSIMSVMMLAAGYNTRLLLQTAGSDEQDAAHAIAELFRANFNES